ncbi:DNA-deoxyinosine glycosylase [Methylocystis echinoides]|uniref:DNA-deoxyinosine glycosylase n=1 Tax=Methylocystis echinoides TaxID=29468 RepID=UPI00341F154C
MDRSVGLPLVARRDARLLVLGTLPGVAALTQRQYYAHRQNSFWKIMGALIGFSPDLPYERRLALVTDRGVAIWNVLAEAERRGSVDANIRSPAPNDFAPFFAAHGDVRLICFNGREAQTLFKRLVRPALPEQAAALPSAVLPSTSPTHARMRFDEKLARWREAFTSA